MSVSSTLTPLCCIGGCQCFTGQHLRPGQDVALSGARPDGSFSQQAQDERALVF